MFKITDKSVHVGSSIYAHKSRIPTEDIGIVEIDHTGLIVIFLGIILQVHSKTTMYICVIPSNSVRAIASATCQYI